MRTLFWLVVFAVVFFCALAAWHFHPDVTPVLAGAGAASGAFAVLPRRA